MAITTAPQSGGMPSGQIYGAGIQQPALNPIGQALFNVADTYLQTQTNKKIAQRQLEGQIAGQTAEGLERVRNEETFLNQIFGKSATLQGAEQSFATAAVIDKFNDLNGELATNLYTKKPQEFEAYVKRELEPLLATGDPELDLTMLEATRDLQNSLFSNYAKLRHEHEQELYIQSQTAKTLAKVDSTKNSGDLRKLGLHYLEMSNADKASQQVMISQILGEVQRGERESIQAIKPLLLDKDNPLDLKIDDLNRLRNALITSDSDAVDAERKEQAYARAYSLRQIETAAKDINTSQEDIVQMVIAHREDFGFEDDSNFGKWVADFDNLELPATTDNFALGYQFQNLKNMAKNPETDISELFIQLKNFGQTYGGFLSESEQQSLGATLANLENNIRTAELRNTQSTELDPQALAIARVELQTALADVNSSPEVISQLAMRVAELGGDIGSKTEAGLHEKAINHSLRQVQALHILDIVMNPDFNDVFYISNSDASVLEDVYNFGLGQLMSNSQATPEIVEQERIRLVNRLPVLNDLRNEFSLNLGSLLDQTGVPKESSIQTINTLMGMVNEGADTEKASRYLTEANDLKFKAIRDRVESGMPVAEAIMDFHHNEERLARETRLLPKLKEMYDSRDYDRDFKAVADSFGIGSSSSRNYTVAQTQLVLEVREEMARIAARNPRADYKVKDLRERAISNLKETRFDNVIGLTKDRIQDSPTLGVRQNTLTHTETLPNQINYFLRRQEKDIPLIDKNDTMIYNPLNDTLTVFRTSGEFTEGRGTLVLPLDSIEREWVNSFTYRREAGRLENQRERAMTNYEAAMGLRRDYNQWGAGTRAATGWALPEYIQETEEFRQRREQFIENQ